MGPLPNVHSWLVIGGGPDHLLSRMILQVGGFKHQTMNVPFVWIFCGGRVVKKFALSKTNKQSP